MLKYVHSNPHFKIVFGKSGGIKELPTRRRKDRDNDNDKENGLRMRNEREKLKEKRFSFFAHPQKEKRYADTQLAHCLLPDTRATLCKSQRAKSFIPQFSCM